MKEIIRKVLREQSDMDWYEWMDDMSEYRVGDLFFDDESMDHEIVKVEREKWWTTFHIKTYVKRHGRYGKPYFSEYVYEVTEDYIDKRLKSGEWKFVINHNYPDEPYPYDDINESMDWLKGITDNPREEMHGNLTVDDLEVGNSYIYKINWDKINNDFGGMVPALSWMNDYDGKSFKVLDKREQEGYSPHYTILVDGMNKMFSGGSNFFQFAKFIKNV